MDLTTYDRIVISTSGGKDSQAMMDYVTGLAREQGVTDRLVAVHADLGRVEWKGTRDLAAEQAAAYGIPFHVVQRTKGDLLEQIEARGMFPDSKNRYCTSDQKRAQIFKFYTRLADEHRANGGGQIRILNCMGLRAQESPARAKKVELAFNKLASNGRRHVDDWLPILSWKVEQVWETIKASGVRHHEAYDLGMPRLSCVFCVFSTRSALMIAGEHNPELLDEYCRVEEKIGHTFQNGKPISEIRVALQRGDRVEQAEDWAMA